MVNAVIRLNNYKVQGSYAGITKKIMKKEDKVFLFGFKLTIALFPLFLCLLTTAEIAAQDNAGDIISKIENRKIALISKQLDLTTEQAERFWPIYKEYSAKKIEINRNFRNLRKQFDVATASEEELTRMINMATKVKQRQLNLDTKYNKSMTQVISNRQLLQLRQAEENVRKKMMESLRKRKLAEVNRRKNTNRQSNRINN